MPTLSGILILELPSLPKKTPKQKCQSNRVGPPLTKLSGSAHVSTCMAGGTSRFLW